MPTNPDGTRSVDREWDQAETWRQMEEVYKTGIFRKSRSDLPGYWLTFPQGKVKAIGVSNWSIPYLEHLEKSWKVVPAVNQVI